MCPFNFEVAQHLADEIDSFLWESTTSHFVAYI